MAHGPGILALAGTRADLEAALTPDQAGAIVEEKVDSGWLFRLDPEGISASAPVARRQAAEALRSFVGRDIAGFVRLEGETLTADLTARPAAPSAAALDPTWLDWVPASAVATVTLALDPSPAAWDRAFVAADRIERADPARAGLAPLRTRLNLIALAAKVRPEVDLWPALRGATVVVLAGPDGAISGALVVLHAADPAAAERLGREVIPRLTASWAKGSKPADGEGTQHLGQVSGRPLAVTHRESSVVIGWGEPALRAALEARHHPDRSAGAAIRAAWGNGPAPQRAGAFWPGRVPNLTPSGSPLALALNESPPILWWGRNEGRDSRDTIRWTGLRGLVHRFLDRLRLDPPPERGGRAG